MLKKYYEADKSYGLQKPRAYYVPFEKNARPSREREDSKRFLSLNGAWKITAYESVTSADGFWEKEGEKRITVPSCVQYFGYDYFQYTNVRYPFPFDPPRVPTKNPAYHYSRKFSYSKNGEKAYIVFEGVDSCFYLYVNGNFVGFSQISHRISEFDITEHLVDGENKIDVLVLKFCFGSYLEDQDKWRFTGIFRDVYILRRPKKHLTDFKIETGISGKNGFISFINKSEESALVEVGGQSAEIKGGETHRFIIENPRLWSAETPELYDVTITSGEEKIFLRSGIKTSCVKNGVFLLNGKPVKLFGVNRHDFHPEKGAAVSKQDMINDILLMKSLNVNALRTSHYPASPLLYETCDEYGLYVMSESDFESHGCADHGNPQPTQDDFFADYSIIAEDKRFLNAILERQTCNVEEHKNHACVVIWSLGNESGWGKNIIAAAKHVKSLSDLPIHYENLDCRDRRAYGDDAYYSAPLDMLSRMYAGVDFIKNVFLKDKRETRPLVLCEYAHAMGNGSGGLKNYIEAFESSNKVMGGFVWEWADHGVSYGGKTQRYGGDFGEFEHDVNFCLDGIVLANRALKPGTLSMKKAYQPLKFTKTYKGFTVFNKNFFAPAAGELLIKTEQGEQKLAVAIEPRKQISVSVASPVLTVQYFEGENERAREQLGYPTKKVDSSAENACAKPIITQNGNKITVSSGGVDYVLDSDCGEIISVKFGGQRINGVHLNLWRAPTDNDKNQKIKWYFLFLKQAKPNVIKYVLHENGVDFSVSIGSNARKPLFSAELSYRFIADGVKIGVKYKQLHDNYYDYLPRFGFIIEADKSFNKLKYCAYGPQETYSDTYDFAFKGEYEGLVENEYFHYPMPQDGGSHYLADYAQISNGKNVIYAEGMQSFSALPYSANELELALHDDELPAPSATYFCLDVCMSGLGSNSCGPMPLLEYRVPKNGKGEIIIKFK